MGDVEKETVRITDERLADLAQGYETWGKTNSSKPQIDIDTAAALRELLALRQPDTRMEGGGEAVGWETEAEWELEQRAFHWNDKWSTEETRSLINDLWEQYCLAAAPSSPTVGELEVVVWDRLRELIGEYFDLGYAEGVAQRDADTMAGDAQRTLSEIEGIISAAQSNKHGLEQLLEEKRAAINSLRPLFHSTKAQLAEARKVLERISSPTQTEGILWWQIEARAFLASLGEKQDAE